VACGTLRHRVWLNPWFSTTASAARPPRPLIVYRKGAPDRPNERFVAAPIGRGSLMPIPMPLTGNSIHPIAAGLICRKPTNGWS
jgi:hypothetical protein